MDARRTPKKTTITTLAVEVRIAVAMAFSTSSSLRRRAKGVSSQRGSNSRC